MDRIVFKRLSEFWEIVKNNGLKPYAIGLKGSQNYNLSDDESDYDANLVFIPTLKQLRNGDKYSFKSDFGEVTCHNIYKFSEICAKGNPQWIEVVNSKYHIGSMLEWIDSFQVFKKYNLSPQALKGMLMEKVHAFDKLFEGRKHIVEKFGYNPKQLHHIIRLYDLLKHNVPIYEYHGDERDFMMDVKRGRYPKTKDEAFKMRDEYVQKINEIYECRKEKYTPIEVDYDELDKIFIEELK